jgi:NTP pyrophosphatase (non-canonical NTP hydrolase)
MLKEYTDYVRSTARVDPDYIAKLFLDNRLVTTENGDTTVGESHAQELLAAIGLAGEAGEFLEHYKKWLFHKKPLDYSAIILEAGDLFWYFTLWCDATGIDLYAIIEANKAKLDARRAAKERQFAEDK